MNKLIPLCLLLSVSTPVLAEEYMYAAPPKQQNPSPSYFPQYSTVVTPDMRLINCRTFTNANGYQTTFCQ